MKFQYNKLQTLANTHRKFEMIPLQTEWVRATLMHVIIQGNGEKSKTWNNDGFKSNFLIIQKPNGILQKSKVILVPELLYYNISHSQHKKMNFFIFGKILKKSVKILLKFQV